MTSKTLQRLAVVRRDVLTRLGLAKPAEAGGPPAVQPVRRMLPEAIAFQTELEEIIEELPPPLIRITNHSVAALLIILLVLGAVLHVDMIVQASGHLVADTPTIVLQPAEHAIIRALLVKPGDVVAKGAVLARLDPTNNDADVTALAAQKQSLAATIRRLRAELEGGTLAQDSSDAESVLQAALFQQRQAQYAARLRGFEEAISSSDAEIRATQDTAAVLNRQLAVARNVEAMRAELFNIKVGSRLQYLDAQTQTMRTERDFQEQVDHLRQLQHAIDGKRAEREAFIHQWRADATEQLGHARDDLAKVEDSLAKAARLRDLVVVKAPADGVVLDVAMRSVGSVLHDAEPLITLLPTNAALIAVVLVKSGDVGYLQQGAEVGIKVDAFPYQKHGLLHGRLRSIGEQTYGPEGAPPRDGIAPQNRTQSGAFHEVQVALTDTQLRDMQKGRRLIPGMTVNAELKVGSRSILAYFLYPITKGFDQSIREP